jgi:hypothetical protein
MKERFVDTVPPCDICKKDNLPAVYDAPTNIGPWANMCSSCLESNGRTDAATLGTKLILRDRSSTPAPSSEILDAVGDTELTEENVFDSVHNVACPTCGEERTLELDASGIVTCEGCNQKYRVKALI